MRPLVNPRVRFVTESQAGHGESDGGQVSTEDEQVNSGEPMIERLYRLLVTNQSLGALRAVHFWTRHFFDWTLYLTAKKLIDYY